MRVNEIVSKTSIESIFEDLDPKSEVYVDMDGVLADFFGVWNKMMGVRHWKEIKDTDAALQKIKDTDDFWINLPMTRNGKSLLNAIKRFKGKYNILSAPLPGDPNSEPQKREWIKKHLSMFPPAKIIIDHDKAKYAKQPDGTPNALIDDFGQNINKWENAGGVGIQHKDIQIGNTISRLAKALDTEKEIDESFDNPYEYEWVRKMPASWAANAPTENGKLQVQFQRPKPRQWSIAFQIFSNDAPITEPSGYKKTGTGDQFRIFATTIAVIRDWVSQMDLSKINSIKFVANKVDDGAGRARLYVRFAKQMANELGWELNTKTAKKGDTFVIQKPKKVSENFADGKVKGKSRPGRVKRSGASCNGSVTELRAKAKKSSGEKAKMYHWCANMKSGKKK